MIEIISQGYICNDCVHNDKEWYEEPCDSCCGAHCGYEKDECPKAEAQAAGRDWQHTFCNRIIIDGKKRVAVVKDTCAGCKIDHEHCAIDDLLEATGMLDGWEKSDLENFRDRVNKRHLVNQKC